MPRGRIGRKRRLVVGGGHAPARQVYVPELDGYIEVRAFPSLKPKDVALNIDPDASPDVVGDIRVAPFASEVFAEVYFEKVPHELLTVSRGGALKEAARVLEVDGRLIIETGAGVPLEQLKEALRMAGFSQPRITRKGFIRITGRRGELP